MITTHITLVGAQVIPIYKGIKEFNPDKVILIHTKETIANAEIIKKIYALDSPSTEAEFVEVDPVNYISISSALIPLFDFNHEFSVNISGGTKIMALALFEIAMNKDNATVFYIDQNDVIFDFKSKINRTPPKFIDIITTFKLSNNPLTGFKKLSDFSLEEISSHKKVRQMMNFNINEYSKLMTLARGNTDQSYFKTVQGSSYSWHPQEKRLTISLQHKKGYKQTYIFDTVNAVKLIRDTEWFELEVAGILSKWALAKELIIGARIQYQAGADKNEIDIIVNTGQKLLFIECKTQVFDIKDIDKFRNVVKNYGGLGAKSILITNNPANPRVIEKCKDNHIKYICLSEQNEKEVKLFEILESELLSNNPI